MPACGVCGLKAAREVDALLCGHCHTVYHAKCEGMSEFDVKDYRTLSPIQRQAWRCKICTNERDNLMRENSATSGGDSVEKLSTSGVTLEVIQSHILRIEGNGES
ncbi:hypothetical protein DMENIID0001_111880 [Sergentomyia squamirostris]